MNEVFCAGMEYLEAVYWANECELYAKSYVVGKKWRLGDGDREAIRIMQQALNDEKVAFLKMEKLLNA